MYSHFIHRALGTLCGMAMVEQKQNNASKNVPANVKKQKHTLMHLPLSCLFPNPHGKLVCGMGRSLVLCTTKTPPESRFVAFAAMLRYSVLLPSTLQPPRLARSSVAEMFTNIYQPKNPRPLPLMPCSRTNVQCSVECFRTVKQYKCCCCAMETVCCLELVGSRKWQRSEVKKSNVFQLETFLRVTWRGSLYGLVGLCEE